MHIHPARTHGSWSRQSIANPPETRSPWRTRSLGVLLAVAATVVATAAPAATTTVCASGCDHASLQTAVDLASPGDLIRILDRNHTEPNIVIATSLTLEGGHEMGTRLQAQSNPENPPFVGRVLSVALGVQVVLRDLTLRYGNIDDDAGGILNHGQLTLERVQVVDNEATSDGGGIFNDGTLILRDSLVYQNDAGSDGGGIENAAGATLVAVDSVIEDNTASFKGGNLSTRGTAVLTGSTVLEGSAFSGGGIYTTGTLHFSGLLYDNLADSGGGIYAASGALEIRGAYIHLNTAQVDGGGVRVANGTAVIQDTTFADNEANTGGGLSHGSATTARLVNSTFSHNTAHADGGGIYVDGGRRIELASSTVADNSADSDEDGTGDGGGIYMALCVGTCTTTHATLRTTILADNTDRSPSGPLVHDCRGGLSSAGHNLFGQAGTGAASPCYVEGDLTGVVFGADPQLGPLGDQGGTPTHSGGTPPPTRFLSVGSIAIDGGDPTGCTDPDGDALPTDQRGAGRVGTCDVGSYEAGGVPAVAIFRDGFESGGTWLWSTTS